MVAEHVVRVVGRLARGRLAQTEVHDRGDAPVLRDRRVGRQPGQRALRGGRMSRFERAHEYPCVVIGLDAAHGLRGLGDGRVALRTEQRVELVHHRHPAVGVLGVGLEQHAAEPGHALSPGELGVVLGRLARSRRRLGQAAGVRARHRDRHREPGAAQQRLHAHELPRADVAGSRDRHMVLIRQLREELIEQSVSLLVGEHLGAWAVTLGHVLSLEVAWVGAHVHPLAQGVAEDPLEQLENGLGLRRSRTAVLALLAWTPANLGYERLHVGKDALPELGDDPGRDHSLVLNNGGRARPPFCAQARDEFLRCLFDLRDRALVLDTAQAESLANIL